MYGTYGRADAEQFFQKDLNKKFPSFFRRKKTAVYTFEQNPELADNAADFASGCSGQRTVPLQAAGYVVL